MKLDFWNNPIIVSAFRVRYRRGGLFNITSLYLVALVIGGIFLYRYQDRLPAPFPRIYLLCLLGLQFFISALIAGSTTAASMRSEVANRTLDFQRITSLSPRQILLGKLLGEPSLAYLLAIATIPLAAWCWMMGVMGVSLLVLALLYLSVATTTLMVGSLGLLHSLDPTTGKSTSNAAGLGTSLAVLIAVVILASNRMFLGTPWARAIAGLATPFTPFYGIAEGNPWLYGLNIFGFEIPFLLVTPLSQLFLSSLCFQVMVRRLINPLNPAFSKTMAYITLLIFDLLAGAVLFEPAGFGLPLGRRGAAFCLAHLVVSLALVATITPWRESLHSWVWRLRGPSPRLFDLWLGARSENILSLLTFCLIGAAGLVTFVLLPGWREEGTARLRGQGDVIGSALAASMLLLLALGTLYQWCVAVGGRSGKGVFASLVMVLIVPAHLAGWKWEIDLLQATTPTAQFARWLNGDTPFSLLPLLGTYGILFIVCWALLRRYVSRVDRVVRQKLQFMGVRKAVA